MVNVRAGSVTLVGSSFQVPPAGDRNGVIQCFITPARTRLIVFGAMPSGLSFVFLRLPMGVPRSVQSIVAAAGSAGGFTSWLPHDGCGHTYRYWPYLP